MNELAEQIYNQLKSSAQSSLQYNYSNEPTIKCLELVALKELESEHYIAIKTKSITYAVVDVL